MAWEAGESYSIETTTHDGEQTLTYLGNIKLEWTFEEVHVFRAQDESLIGLRNEDITSARRA